MKTTLKGRTTEVTIDHHGPMTIIGESINPTRRARLSEAFRDQQYDYVLELAEAQIDAGADVLDINVGVPGIDEVTIMREVVKTVSAQFDVPQTPKFWQRAYPQRRGARWSIRSMVRKSR